jgi:hypothetical protein
MARTHELSKMPIVPFGEGPSRHPNPVLKSQIVVMAVDVLEVKPMAVIPPAGG